MSRATVLQWVQDLSCELADPQAVPAEYTEAIVALGHDQAETWFGHFTLTSAALDEELKFVPEDLVRIHAVFYDQTMLSWETVRSMEALDPTWRTRRHTPQAYITDQVPDRLIRLWPPSDIDCEELGWLYTQRLDDAQPFLDLPLALLTLAREFGRESPHRDPEYAALCEALGMRMLAMVAA